MNFNLVGSAVSAEPGEALLEEPRDRRRQRELECRIASRRRHLVPGLGQDTGELVGIGLGHEIVEVVREEYEAGDVLQRLRLSIRLEPLLANEPGRCRPPRSLPPP